jgi:hypothetical protein
MQRSTSLKEIMERGAPLRRLAGLLFAPQDLTTILMILSGNLMRWPSLNKMLALM